VSVPIIHPNVSVGPEAVLGEYVLIGVPPRGCGVGELETIVGRGAVIRSHSVIYAGNVIGANFQAGHGVMIRELNEIGDDVSVGTHSVIEHHVRIASRVRIHSNAFIPEYTILEEGAWVGPNVVVTNARYPLSPGAKDDLQGVRISRGAKIGANVTILPGVVIGRDALVGAGAVVVRDVLEGQVVVGNPARVVRSLRDLPAYDLKPGRE